jgi:hypothetical protein
LGTLRFPNVLVATPKFRSLQYFGVRGDGAEKPRCAALRGLILEGTAAISPAIAARIFGMYFARM